MSVLVGKNTRVVGQGITGKAGTQHALNNIAYGTNYVAAVTPGKGGGKWEDKLPIFNSVHDAVAKEGANTSVIFVPPPFAADGILEAIDAGIELIICITEGIPVRDMTAVKDALIKTGGKTRLIGPNCPGIMTPGECNIGIMPGYIAQPGKVGVVSRSGTLTYEAMYQLTVRGYGQSTCIGIGGDPINGTSHIDAVKLFNEDPATEAIILIGEIGGSAEEEAAAYIKEHVKKPVAAFIAGTTAPPGRRMGHAGAIVSGSSGSAETKIAALKDAGIAVAPTPSEIGETLLSIYS
ncbi:succinate--CoA ligase subunit alpha [Cerasicoccus maritimus]|uniref:succinate--CoA ligase subunit alpha n=1 Tax=Cerasicoccus maritimus TaxID=490089 RepID=UPI0028525F10|nr:succinate--CoA ligase subunit alpha [Cerasicoccus maritimus]